MDCIGYQIPSGPEQTSLSEAHVMVWCGIAAEGCAEVAKTVRCELTPIRDRPMFALVLHGTCNVIEAKRVANIAIGDI
jgi:hypothetical protein